MFEQDINTLWRFIAEIEDKGRQAAIDSMNQEQYIQDTKLEIDRLKELV